MKPGRACDHVDVHPILFEVPLPGGGAFPIASFGVLVSFVAVFGAWLTAKCAVRGGLTSDDGVDMALCLALGGIVGAKTLQAVIERDRFLVDPLAFLLARDAGVMQGALMGAIACVVVRSRMKGWPIGAAVDALAPAWAIGHGVLRVGCFLSGCCFGAPSSTWGVQFPSDSVAYGQLLRTNPSWLDGGQTVPLFPIQLFEAGFEVLVGAAIVAWTFKGRPPRGAVAASWLTAYSAFRFWAETVRADPERGEGVLGLASTTQLLAVVLFAVGAIGLAIVVRRSTDRSER